MKKIYAATDFSDVSENAVKYAAALANQFRAALHLVHVYESPLFYTAEMPYIAIESAESMAKDDAENKMSQLVKELSADYKELKVFTVVKRGISAESIIEEADSNAADLLVAGSTGSGVIERTLIGSTTTSLINKSKCMVLIVPEKATFKGVKTLVYATDLKDKNLISANALLPLAGEMNAELVFLFVDNKIHSDSEKISDEMAEKIKAIVHYPKTSGYVCTDPDVMNGISLFINRMKAEMVAMVTHHRSFPSMLWDSSLTTKFSHHPEVPLLVIHDESEKRG